jgi:SAM-dependent methyltransferase
MTLAPSPWVQRWSHLVPPRGSVLDVACGSGRHVRWFADRGCRVTAVDRDAAAVEPLQAIAELLVADIENGPWPFAGRRFDAVIVTNYLWRPLLPTLIASVADGGVLIYETFADGNQTVGKPSNPDFLLKPGELLQAAQGLEVVAYENGFLDTPPRFVQRMAAMKSWGAAAPFPRRHLASGTSTPGRLKSSDSEEPA